MASIGDLTVDVRLNISEETAQNCVKLLNMYLEGSTQEALVEVNEKGDSYIFLQGKRD